MCVEKASDCSGGSQVRLLYLLHMAAELLSVGGNICSPGKEAKEEEEI